MKLDNRGWGLRKMIMYSCAILCCLLIATYYVNYLYRDLQKSLDNSRSNNTNVNQVQNNTPEKKEDEIVFDQKYYDNLELKLYTSTVRFVEAGFVDPQQELTTVTSERLIKDGYLTTLVDQKGDTCSGYSNVINDGGNDYIVKSYIKCNDYYTK